MGKHSRPSAPSEPPVSPAMQGAVAACMGLVACASYVATLYQDVPGGDSGELIMAAANWGVAHPPGYPLYTLLAHLFSLLPLGSVAWRVNLLSAVCDSLAVALLAATVVRHTRNVPAAMAAAGMFAWSCWVWTTAVAAEVFALNNLFVCGLLYQAVCFEQAFSIAAKKRYLPWGCLWVGLGLANHHTFVFVALMWLGYVGQALGAALRPALILRAAACGLLGLSPYLYLPWAAAHPNLDTWADVSSWSGFVHHFLRRDYGTFQLTGGNMGASSSLGSKLWIYLRGLSHETLYLGLVVACAGAIRWARQARLGCWLMASFVLYLAVLLALSNLDMAQPLYLGIAQRFWQQAHCVVFVWLGAGWAWAVAQLKLRRPAWQVLLACAAVAGQGAHNYHENNRRGTHVLQDFARTVLLPLPSGALLLASGDHITYTLRYAQQFAKLRADVQIVDQFKLLSFWGTQQYKQHFLQLDFPGDVLLPDAPANTFNLAQLFAANHPRHALFVVNEVRLPDRSYAPNFRLWPMGYVEQILPATSPCSLQRWVQRAEEGMKFMQPALLPQCVSTSWECEIWRQYWQAKHLFAAALYVYAEGHGQNREALALAITTFEEVQKNAPIQDVRLLKNLGAAYHMLTQYDPAARHKMARTWRRYLQQAPAGDADVPTIARLIDGVR